MPEIERHVCMVRAADGAYWLSTKEDVEVPEAADAPGLTAYPSGLMIQTHDLDADDRVTLLVEVSQTAEVKTLDRLRASWPHHSNATVTTSTPLYVVDAEAGALAQVTSGPGTWEVHLLTRTREPDDYWRQHPDDPLEDHLITIWPQGAPRRFDE